jgi:hypothetical protein
MQLLPLPPPLEAVVVAYVNHLIFLAYAQKIDDVLDRLYPKILV